MGKYVLKRIALMIVTGFIIMHKRVAKAEYELTFAPQFDKIILNDNLDDARAEMLHTIREFLDKE